MKRVIFLLTAMLLVSAAARATATCSATASLAFGSFNPLPGQSADTAGTISVTCVGTAGESPNYTITITSGLGSFTARRMVSGAHNLSYNLYTDSSCTQVWGDGTSSTRTVSDSMTLTSTSNTKNYLIYGRIASGQKTDPAGTYNDSLVVTITY
jgi:spore coat protein U-like protein